MPPEVLSKPVRILFMFSIAGLVFILCSKSTNTLKQYSASLPKNRTGIGALLDSEMIQSSARTQEQAAPTVPSHRHPQQLLATELIFRMFDTSWQVRHGSLLGILALLQAWKTSVTRTFAYGEDNDTKKHADVFGQWPETY